MSVQKPEGRPSLIGHVSFGAAHVALAAIISMMLLVSFEVFIRKVFGMSTKIAHDMAGFFLVAVTFFGAAQTLRMGKHLRVGILFDRLSPRARFALDLVNVLIAICFVLLLAVATTFVVIDSYTKGTLTDGVVQFPKYIPELIMPLGLGIFLLQLFEELYKLLKR